MAKKRKRLTTRERAKRRAQRKRRLLLVRKRAEKLAKFRNEVVKGYVHETLFGRPFGDREDLKWIEWARNVIAEQRANNDQGRPRSPDRAR